MDTHQHGYRIRVQLQLQPKLPTSCSSQPLTPFELAELKLRAWRPFAGHGAVSVQLGVPEGARQAARAAARQGRVEAEVRALEAASGGLLASSGRLRGAPHSLGKDAGGLRQGTLGRARACKGAGAARFMRGKAYVLVVREQVGHVWGMQGASRRAHALGKQRKGSRY